MVNLRVSTMEESENLLQPRSFLSGHNHWGFLLPPVQHSSLWSRSIVLMGQTSWRKFIFWCWLFCLLKSQANSVALPEIWLIMVSVSSISPGTLVDFLIHRRVFLLLARLHHNCVKEREKGPSAWWVWLMITTLGGKLSLHRRELGKRHLNLHFLEC